MTCSQQEGGQTMPLESMASRQHWPQVAIQRGAEHSFMAISPIPPTAARPRPEQLLKLHWQPDQNHVVPPGLAEEDGLFGRPRHSAQVTS